MFLCFSVEHPMLVFNVDEVPGFLTVDETKHNKRTSLRSRWGNVHWIWPLLDLNKSTKKLECITSAKSISIVVLGEPSPQQSHLFVRFGFPSSLNQRPFSPWCISNLWLTDIPITLACMFVVRLFLSVSFDSCCFSTVVVVLKRLVSRKHISEG